MYSGFIGAKILEVAGRTPAELETEAEDRVAAKHERQQATQRALREYWARFKVAPESAQPVTEPIDDLADCATCHRGRWLRRDVPITDPEFGRVVRCQDCLIPSGDPAVLATKRRALVDTLDLSDDQQAMTFDTFRARQGTEMAFRAAQAWAAQPTGWLVIHGTAALDRGVGCGKTHLLMAVLNQLAHDLRPVRWWYGADLVRHAKRRMQDGTALDDFLRQLEETPILLLDDLGTVRSTPWAIQEFLEPLFDKRYRLKLPTLVTCIGDPEAVKDGLSESIGRRMQDRRVCQVVQIRAGQYGARP